eukprot:3825400-Pleurochrysis_carterae.AAC.1
MQPEAYLYGPSLPAKVSETIADAWELFFTYRPAASVASSRHAVPKCMHAFSCEIFYDRVKFSTTQALIMAKARLAGQVPSVPLPAEGEAM